MTNDRAATLDAGTSCGCFRGRWRQAVPQEDKKAKAASPRSEGGMKPQAPVLVHHGEQDTMPMLGTCCWATVPPEILGLVFLKLDGTRRTCRASGAARLVCANWYAILTVRRKCLYPRYCGLHGIHIELQKFPAVQHVDLAGCTACTDSLIMKLADVGTLTSLAAPGCRLLTARGIASLNALRNNLTDLNLTDCYRINDQAVAEIGQLTALRRLNLSGCRAITDTGVSPVTNLTGLKELRVSQCPKISDETLDSIGLLHGLQVWHLCLSHLDLSGCSITDEGLAGFEALQELLLKGCNKVDGSFLHSSGSRASLRTLQLAGCSLSDSNLADLCQECVSLRKLNVAHCRGISSCGVHELTALKMVEDLDLSSCAASSEIILLVVSSLEQLTALSLRGCDAVTDNTLANISLKGPRQCLRSLNLGSCRNISDEGALYLTQLKSLTALNLQYCDALSDDVIAALARDLPVLNVLTTDRVCENNLTRFNGTRVFKRIS